MDHLPASEMGLSALIKPDAAEITLRVRASFALYLQHTPTHDQQVAIQDSPASRRMSLRSTTDPVTMDQSQPQLPKL